MYTFFVPRKVVSSHEDVWGNGDLAPPLSTSELDGFSGQLHALAALTPGKEPLVQME
jgi:hypothetical protein